MKFSPAVEFFLRGYAQLKGSEGKTVFIGHSSQSNPSFSVSSVAQENKKKNLAATGNFFLTAMSRMTTSRTNSLRLYSHLSVL